MYDIVLALSPFTAFYFSPPSGRLHKTHPLHILKRHFRDFSGMQTVWIWFKISINKSAVEQ